MTTLKEFLVALHARGVQLYLEDGKLKSKSPPGAITDDIAARIRENKDALVELLRAAGAATPADAALVPVAAAQRGALSFAQQRIWFLDQFGNGSAQYNMPAALRLAGALDRAALQATLDELVRRHEILRTVYRTTGSGGVQDVLAPAALAIESVELAHLPETERETRVEALIRREASTGFDLARDPMLRVVLARLAPERHVLLLTLHHIAADGWSLGILVKEFVALYPAFAAGQAPHLPPLPIQYADYAHWQRQALAGAPMQRQLAYWREALAGVPQLHNLPTDALRPPQLASAGRSLRCTVEAELLSALNALASRHGASLFMLLHAAFALLLARWSDASDVVVGTPVAGRERKETEGLIGCFINTLALRSRLSPDTSFEQWLAQSRAATLRAFEHQSVPFEMVVEDLNPPRSLSHTPLFQVMFALQNYEVGALELPGLRVEALPIDAQGIKFDIAVMASEIDGALRMLWTYCDAVFEPATVDSLAASYLTLLRSIVREPGADIQRLALLTPQQCDAVCARAERAGHAQRVLDAHGAVQPIGARGHVCRAQRDANGAVTWIDTGALGRLRESGALEVLHRRDEDATLNGHRIATATIEAELLDTGLLEAACVGVHRDGAQTPLLVAYLAAGASDRAALVEACREALKQRLPDFMLPAAYVVLDALPRHADGSVDRANLPAPDPIASAKAAPVPPTHELEKQLCAIWCAVLGLDAVGIHDNFFDVGGSSLHTIIVQQEILARTGLSVAVTDLFTYPTVAGLARWLERRDAAEPLATPAKRGAGDIAVIGMSGRFPDAADVDTFWQNLKQGKESLTRYSDEQLLDAGVAAALLTDPNYVKSGVVLDGLRDFDAAYFGFTPREAEVMDPQQRLLFECAVEALEQAGYGDDAAARPVGVYLGTGESLYLFEHLLPQAAAFESMRLAALYGNRPDYAATRLSYRLNLSGPSVNIGTACSTSLVAVHAACQSLLQGECDMALAGGASIAQLGPRGYLYQEGGIASPDGHCRAFDRAAAGTRSGSGAGLVLLKRLEDALADGDTIHAVIKGSAINNDGAEKVGYTAPSVLGQARAIARAHAAAGVAPDRIRYVEAHGTGTPLGDPIEMRALRTAFGALPAQSCALGAVKPNIGHLDSAAGVAGLIKTIKVVAEGVIPPNVNFHEPNPQIDFASGPFYVATELAPWPAGDAPRRAGVSSFGIGGTNAHVVLEQAPAAQTADAPRTPQLIVLSAKTESALASASTRLWETLMRGDHALADIAYTLQVGRAAHVHRLALVADDAAAAASALTNGAAARAAGGASTEPPSTVFLFTGQGAQHLGMGADLYRSEAAFRETVDACAARLEPELGLDLRSVWFAPADDAAAQAALARTDLAQPALFVFEYALARLLETRGVRPDAMIGHSLGEYVAACVAGVFSLEDALKLVSARGRLMQAAAPGAMISVGLDEDETRALLRDFADCALAAVNAPRDCVISGPVEAIRALAAQLEQRGVGSRELRTSHAFHSPLMQDAASRFGAVVRNVALAPPTIPYVSNLSGAFVTPQQATDPEYWVRHLLGTVRFADGIAALETDTVHLRRKRVLLEVGPGITLASLARKTVRSADVVAVACARHAQDARNDVAVLLGALGQLWVNGAAIDWRALHAGERRRRVPLPTYPFERQPYWIERATTAPAQQSGGKIPSLEQWFYAPLWTQAAPDAPPAVQPDDALWLLFADSGGVAAQLHARLHAQARATVVVRRGAAFAQGADDAFVLDPASEDDYRKLAAAIAARTPQRLRVLHLWCADGCEAADPHARLAQAEQAGFGSLLYLARNLDRALPQADVRIDLVTRDLFGVTGEETLAPEFATAAGLCRVIAQEYPQMRVHQVDLSAPALHAADAHARDAERLLVDASLPERPALVAYRGRRRWTLRYERCALARSEPPAIRTGGTYLITGGLGRIGLCLAASLARHGAGALVLVGRNAASRDSADALRAIEALGARVMVCAADVSVDGDMQRVVAAAEGAFGPVHGVIHAAGQVRDAQRPLDAIDAGVRAAQFAPKITGTLVLERVFAGKALDFCLLMGSLSAQLGGLGFGAYAAANAYLDAFAHAKHQRGERQWISLDWDGWLFGASNAPTDRLSMTAAEGAAAFERALGLAPAPQRIVSTADLDARLRLWQAPAQKSAARAGEHARPNIATPYQPAQNPRQQRLLGIWQELLGFDAIGIHDNFFELGGDSILITKVLSQVRAAPEFDGVDLKLTHLFELPTVAQLAEAIERLRTQSDLAARGESLRAQGGVVEAGEI